MNIYIYSDESGVFDNKHEQFYTYGGLILIGNEEKENAIRQFIAVEREIRKTTKCNGELKASVLNPRNKRRLFSSISSYIMWGVVVDIKKVIPEIFNNKKSKQRFLDYAYKIGVKNALKNLMCISMLDFEDIENIHVFCDEHTTATDGKYELKEALEQELKYGTFNYNYNIHFKPILPDMNNITLEFKNSEKSPLIRASDIIANNIYFHSKQNKLDQIRNKIIITLLP